MEFKFRRTFRPRPRFFASATRVRGRQQNAPSFPILHHTLVASLCMVSRRRESSAKPRSEIVSNSPLRCCAFALALLLSSSVFAEPSRIIILRHAEKLNKHELCEIGTRRAEALASQFLGKGAAQSLFASGEKPAAILAVTIHSLETISPTARSWELPAIVYSVLPSDDKEAKERRAQPPHARGRSRRADRSALRRQDHRDELGA